MRKIFNSKITIEPAIGLAIGFSNKSINILILCIHIQICWG